MIGIEKCKSKKHLEDELEKVLEKGGEGIMLRKPGSHYEWCRSSTLLKVLLCFFFILDLPGLTGKINEQLPV